MKIEFHYLNDFLLEEESGYSDWINRIFKMEGAVLDQLDYVFCSDDYLFKVNVEYLNHNTYTDIITFDYSVDERITGDIFISIDRVRENAMAFDVEFISELRRVMSHGVLHLLGYNDKSDEERDIMRSMENKMIELFHVEH